MRLLLTTLFIYLAVTQILIGQSIPESGLASNDPIENYVAAYKKAQSLIGENLNQSLTLADEAIYYAKEAKDSLRIAKSYYLKGFIESKAKHYQQSFEAYSKAIEGFKPTEESRFSAIATWNQGYVLYKLKSWVHSRDKFLSIRHDLRDHVSDNEYSKYLQDLGNSYYFLGEYDQAKATYAEAVSLLPDGSQRAPEFQFHLGQIYKLKGIYDSALAVFDQVILSAQENAHVNLLSLVHNDIGFVQEQLGNLNAALEAYQTAFSLARNLPDMEDHAMRVQLNLAHLYFQREQYPEARNLLKGISNTEMPDHLLSQFYRQSDLLERIDFAERNLAAITAHEDHQLAIVERMDANAKALQQTIHEAKVAQIITDIERKGATDNEPMVATMSTEKQVDWKVWVGGPIILLLMVGLVIQQRKLRKAHHENERLIKSKNKTQESMVQRLMGIQKSSATKVPKS